MQNQMMSMNCPSGRCLISIIVPVYRVEAYLRKCLDSIVCQTYPNLEIILVDDGSPDCCGEICDAYAARDERIRVIHQQNAGIGSARNAGLDISRGDFIMFVDSDDWIDQKTCETVLLAAQQQKADIVCYGYNEIYPSGRVLPYKEEAGEMEKKEVISRLVRGIPTISDVCWNKFVSKRILEDLRFPEGRLHEDLGFTYKMIHLAEKIYVTDAVLYHYYVQHEGSVTDNFYKMNQIEDRVFFLKERLAFLKVYYPEFVDRHIMVIIGELMTGLDRVEGEQNKKIIHKELVEFVRTHKRRIKPFRHKSKSFWFCYYCPEMVKLLLGLRRKYLSGLRSADALVMHEDTHCNP